METLLTLIIAGLFFLIFFAIILLPIASILLTLMGKFSDTDEDKHRYFTWAKKSLLALLFIVLVGGGICFGLLALTPTNNFFPHPPSKPKELL